MYDGVILQRPDRRPLLTTRPVAYQLRTQSTYPFLTYNVFTANNLRYAVTLTRSP